MTSKPIFKDYVLRQWQYLDTILPKGSHLFVLGLVDGRILYDNLHDQIHPLNVTYAQVYDYLNCL